MAGEGGLRIRGASLEARGLTKTFGSTRVVQDVSFKVAGGALLTLLGPSGSGKTTTLRMVAGFEDPDAGQILVADQDITERPAHRRNIGVVFQQYALFPHLTVFDNVAYSLEMRRYGRAEVKSRVGAALDLVRLQGFEARYPRQLSGGQQQRVAIARALVMEPHVMLFDEVTSALDPELVNEVLLLVRDLAEQGMTMVIATHEMSFAREVANTVCFLHDGQILEMGPPAQIFEAPREKRTQTFLRGVLEAGTI